MTSALGGRRRSRAACAARREADRHVGARAAPFLFNQNDRHFNVTAAENRREHDLQYQEKEDAVKAAHEAKLSVQNAIESAREVLNAPKQPRRLYAATYVQLLQVM